MADAVRIAYKIQNEPEEGNLIQMVGFDYYRHTGKFSCGSNKGQAGEPYNYFDEIENIMHANGWHELMESIWYVPEDGLGTLACDLAAAGFALVSIDSWRPPITQKARTI